MIQNPAIFALTQLELQVIVALLEQYPDGNIFDEEWRTTKHRLIDQFTDAINDRNKPYQSKAVHPWLR